MKQNWLYAFVGVLILGATLACTVPSLENVPILNAPTSTPISDTLIFKVPAFTTGLSPGDFVSGTRMQFVEVQESGVYLVRVDSESLMKRPGDSFLWNGIVSPGVAANYRLRIGTELGGQLQVAGPVDLFFLNPAPVELTTLPVDASFITYRNLPIDYRMQPGETIPGTTVVYSGITEQVGSSLATLFGSLSYSRLATGDSFVYTGQLLSQSYVRYALRVASIDDNGLRLVGTADLWVK